MNRPIYENDATLDAENRIAAHFCNRRHYDGYHKLPRSYCLDYAMIYHDPKFRHGRIAAYAECKNRNWRFGDGEGYRLAEQKVRASMLFKSVDGLQSYLVVRFNDGIIRWCPMNTYGDEIIIAGRTDRNDGADLEPHVIFNWLLFKEI